jgi:hypothetical protein
VIQPAGSGAVLLRRPAAGDNAAMQTKPSTADPQKRKRRWFQFSLRTLMIVVALLAAQCAPVMWFIRARDAERFRAQRALDGVAAWMVREHRAQDEADRLRALLRANHIEPPPSAP